MQHTSNFLFTGVTSGIGLGLVDEVANFVKDDSDINFCITCRNMKKGISLKTDLNQKYPTINVILVELNVESIKSVINGCKKIKERFSCLDCVFFNAGIMPTHGVQWKSVSQGLLNMSIVEMLKTGKDMFITKHYINDEGINNVFATNVLGHFAMIQQLLPILSRKESNDKDGGYTKIVWTGSTNALRESFDINDVTCNNGANAYGSSKFVVEAISYELDKRYKDEGIRSYVCDPGTVITNITRSLLPFWVWYVLTPLIWLARSLITNLTLNSHNACHSLIHVLQHNPRVLDSTRRYNSRIDVLNRNYISTELIDTTDSSDIYEQINSIYANVKSRV